MAGLLLSQAFVDRFGDELQAKASSLGLPLDLIVLPDEPGTKLSPEVYDRIELAFVSFDLYRGNNVGFYDATANAKNLRWLQLFGVGIDPINHAPLLARGVRVSNAVGINSEAIAQTAFTGLMVLARGFLGFLESQRRGLWEPLAFDSPLRPRELSDETMVLIGVGAIGSRIAVMAKTLGMRVIGVRRSPRAIDDPVDEMVTPSELDSVLSRADWLVLAPLLTPETERMIDARRLALLPKGARVINISRGTVIDEEALIEALRSGHLGGAYLDVFATEPLPPESPLWRLPNVIVTPHNAAMTMGRYRREADLFFENLGRWSKGMPLLNEVPRE